MPHPYFKPLKAKPGHPWLATDLASVYLGTAAKASLPGGGVIGIVELGGSWAPSDLDAYAKLTGLPAPSVSNIGNPAPDPGGADIEVALDIQIASAFYSYLTGQPATIHVYNMPNDATGIPNGFRASADAGDDVCTISWGEDEAMTGQAGCQAEEDAAAYATGKGTIVFAAAGDNDASDGGPTPANVDCPASCPHVIGCGGTGKNATSEWTWNQTPGKSTGNGTGGGYSTVFPAQPWQVGAPPAPAGLGRMVPDVAGVAAPRTGHRIIVAGKEIVVGGTSAVAPLYAGIMAACGRKLGFVTPKLWSNPSAFADILRGNNGLYKAAPGPDPVTGLGVPTAALLRLFAGA